MRRAARVCSIPGCAVLIRGRGHLCAGHERRRKRGVDARRGTANQRGYGPEWQRIREQYLKDNPFCVVCGQPAVEVDHIIPLRQGGTNEHDNLRPLCKTHHSQRTASEGGGFGNRQVVYGHE